MPWYVYLFAVLWLFWIFYYNQTRFLKDWEKRDPKGYRAFLKEQQRNPWYAPKHWKK